MVKIPSAQDAGFGNVQTRALPNTYQRNNVTAQGVAGVAGQVAGAAANLLPQVQEQMQRIKTEEREARALDAFSGASNETRDAFYGAEGGIFNRTEGAALGTTKEAQSRLDAIRDRYTKDMDEDTREVFNRLWLTKRERTMDTAVRHESQQLQRYRASAANAAVASYSNEAIDAYQNPAAAQAAVFEGVSAIDVAFKDAPAEVREMKRLQFTQ